jgi:integrase
VIERKVRLNQNQVDRHCSDPHWRRRGWSGCGIPAPAVNKYPPQSRGLLRGARLCLAQLAKEGGSLSKPGRSFGSLPLRKITPETVRDYLIQRKEAGLSSATLNIECKAIIRVMRLHRCRRLFIDELRALNDEASTVGRALTDGEQDILLSAALRRPECQRLRNPILLALNTNMCSVERNLLRWQDVDLLGKRVPICRSKTEAGKREIPLNDAAFAACLKLLESAPKQCRSLPERCLFPSCENRPYKSPVTSNRLLQNRLFGTLNALEYARSSSAANSAANF